MIARRDHTAFFAINDISGFLREDLDLTRLDSIQGYLGLAGRPRRVRPLHRYKMIGLDILYTQKMDLHLLKTRTHLMLKPLPLWIPDREIWYRHIDHVQEWHESATGFLMSYVCLLTTPIDLKIAQGLALVHIPITWEWCRGFVEDFLRYVDINTLAQVNKRYHYGDLRRDRINMIYGYRFLTTHLVRGYFHRPNSSVAFFFRNQVWILIGVPGLEDNYVFQQALYAFVVCSIVSLAALLGVVGFVFVAIFLFNMLAAFRNANSRSRRLTRRQLEGKET
ncbi:hypothetical protein BU25DRAFT_470134 [Macroventuria anomochaeta]|uniref:Uncharacterized protein n=1 Tax=Macroventuria anomochaeta TaxID=301207 RepID=A0ACB6SDV1_9PLEO|nr:uncharacterized protein BU25DRAFT_470134 [Macroventuria anomochaeta]KAF2632490.1 hypothetical protein BU25DRAFT_470134 [Macroventuria anomochaeta]